MATMIRPVGEQLREWRQRRRMSQLDLALEADVSARHVSFLETGRARPSRDMLLHLAERLDVPLRERNSLLLGAGFAPAYPHKPLDADMQATISRFLKAHEPFPALAIDRHWNLIFANSSVDLLIGSVDAALLKPPVNVLRLSLHPAGMARRILNLAEWRAHILERLRHQYVATADETLRNLAEELTGYSSPGQAAQAPGSAAEIVIPLRIATQLGNLSFVSTTTVFGTPLDVTLSELALEVFLPADRETAEALHAIAPSRQPLASPLK